MSQVETIAAKAEDALRFDTDVKRLVSPEELIGRQKETEAIKDAIYNLSNGNSAERPRVISIYGDAGTGKSSLARKIGPKDLDGYVCYGKYTPEGGETGLARCISELVRQVVDRDWDMGIRRRLQEFMSPEDAAVLVDTFPSLSLLLETGGTDSIPEPAEVDKTKRANKRQFFFRSLMNSLVKHEVNQYEDEDIEQVAENDTSEPTEITIPLVMILDDLQWAGSASMELISALVKDSDLESFLLIATSRPVMDQSASNPWVQELGHWEGLGVPVESVHLENLDQNDTNELVALMLDRDISNTVPLGDALFQKTKGNPFFSTEFLKALVQQKLVSFDIDNSEWTYDIPRIQCFNTNEDAVGLLKEKLHRLPEDHRLLLMVAACLGSFFGESFLARTLKNIDMSSMLNSDVGMEITRTKEMLATCVDFGVLNVTADNTLHFFAHDLVKEAALSFGTNHQKRWLQMQVGRSLLQSQNKQESSLHCGKDSFLCVGVDLCNVSSAFIIDKKSAEWKELAYYNLLAGQQAMRESAFALAVTYMETGIRYLEFQNQSAEGSQLLLDLLAGATEAVYCNGNCQDMEKYANQVLKVPNCPKMKQIEMMNFQILSSMSQERFSEAIDIGRRAIGMLGMAKFPPKPNAAHVVIELVKTKGLLRRHDGISLSALPVLNDYHRTMAMKIIETIQSAAYSANPNFFIVTFLRSLRWSVKYGISRYSPTLFAIYGFIQATTIGDTAAGVLYSEVALNLAERLNIKETTARTSWVCFSLCRHWCGTDLRDCYPTMAYTQRLSMEVGDTETAVLALGQVMVMSWTAGMFPLQTMARNLYHQTKLLREFQHVPFHDIAIWLAVNLRMLCLPDDDSFDWLDVPGVEKPSLEDVERVRDVGVQPIYDTAAMQRLYLLADNGRGEALRLASRTEEVGLKVAPGLGYVSQCHFYRGLLFLNEACAGRNRRRNLRKGKKVLALMRIWTGAGDINSIHMLHLLQAEQARSLGKIYRAKEIYPVAIKASQKIGRIQDLGIAHECAAEFSLQIGDMKRAAYHVEQAEKAFDEWGAGAKAKQLRDKHGKLLATHGSNLRSVLCSVKA